MTQKNKVVILSMIYITGVVFLTLIPFNNSVDYDINYNLTLFDSINNYIKHMKNFGLVDYNAMKYFPFNLLRFINSIFTVSFKNVLGNIVMFLPFGIFMTYLIKYKKFISVLVYSMSFSIFIEVMQYFFLTSRRADIDDVLLNTFGAIIGYVIYIVMKKLKR
ncbi:hypothetical protein GC105_16240 [Alkalibaculum sp. M08DMB]|uniref:VanZ-like domain-containing protein n=1 Tax=Alkalibaculum sporogenes TaxID=2655001 RepID=A0A6A7KDA9_9FIRM|nr:VanZ family protein [Alkalibaculum sporogenes]MPW27316.1 hypothetical protein [Alkalibaculum sporogenes]